MLGPPLTLSTFARAVVHIDGDAFFASCEQARDPALRGKPVVTGKERGIAASMSYEAKAKGVTRGMRVFEIRRLCPDAIILPSDYETYSLLSKRLFSIVRRYTPDVEEYSIDECFCDVTGLRRVLRMSYPAMARAMKHDLDTELGFTFSVGLAPNKVLAKVASKWQKPSGFTVIAGPDIHRFLAQLPVSKVWGIGANTAALLAKQRVTTALDFARKDELWVKKWLTKPFYETWQELNGRSVLPLITEEKATYQSIQKVKTFTPPSHDRAFVFSQLSKNVENACIKARKYKLAAKAVVIMLKTQAFRLHWVEVRLSRATAFPQDIVRAIEPAFTQLFTPQEKYRATGIVLTKLEEDTMVQLDLFGEVVRAEKLSRVYQAVDRMREQYGKHTVFLGSSLLAQQFAQHLGARGDEPLRRRQLFKGETKRQRLGMPMFMGKLIE
jgi:nucleotidyltransferase/DNA polymerase involved in DNA repair